MKAVHWILPGVASAVLALGGCAVTDDTTAAPAAAKHAEQADAMSYYEARLEGLSQYLFAESGAEALPNQSYRDAETGEVFTATAQVLVGQVTGAKIDSAYVDGEGDDVAAYEVDPYADDADWRLVKLTLDLQEQWPEGAQEGSLLLPIAGGDDIESALDRFAALGGIVAFVDQDGRVFGNELLLGTVDDEGNIRYAGAEEYPGFVESVDTLDEIRAGMREKTTPITVENGIRQ